MSDSLLYKGNKTSEYLQHLIERALKQRVNEDTKVFKPSVKKDPNTSNVSGQAKAPKDQDDARTLKRGDIEVTDIVDKLNAIRAGHSTRDQDIAQELEIYFDDLEPPERIALFAYLKGIAEIVSGEHAGQQAEEPGDPDPSIKMKRQQKGQKKLNPDVVVKGNNNSGGEDRSPPNPIQPKTRG